VDPSVAHDAPERWFVGSAAAAAVALWVSAATAVPVLVGIGLGALLTLSPLVGSPSASGTWRAEPALWRLWGATGAALSLLFYVIEYAPAHFGVRLEVNHPLYAAAWLGAGDVLFRCGRRLQRKHEVGPLISGAAPWQKAFVEPDRLWILLDALLILPLPALILLARASTFSLADPFLWTLHQRFIVEFLSLSRHLALMSPGEIAAGVSVLPVVAIPVAAVLWGGRVEQRRTWGDRGVLLAAGTVGVAFLAILIGGLIGASGRPGGEAVPSSSRGASSWILGLVLSAGVVAALGWLARTVESAALPAPRRAQLAFVLLPPLLPTALSLGQVRWLGIATGLWLASAVVATSALSSAAVRWGAARRVTAAALLAALLVPYPIFALQQAAASSRAPAYQPDDIQQLVTRELSHWLRARVGSAPAVVFGSPTATSRMIYFGGFRGVGTLYWENLVGLRSAAALASASSAESARATLRERGVTHLVLFSWDSVLESPRRSSPTTGEAPAPAGESFLAALAGGPDPEIPMTLPTWLIPLPYPLPPVGVLEGVHARIFEVVPDLPPELHRVRLAQYYRASEAPALAERELRESLAIRPNVPALALLALLRQLANDSVGFAQSVAQMRVLLPASEALELTDHINAIVALVMSGDLSEASRQLERALASADEAAVRRAPPDALVILIGLARQSGLDQGRGALLDLATSLLPASEREALGR
jgi:hypothetical protein